MVAVSRARFLVLALVCAALAAPAIATPTSLGSFLEAGPRAPLPGDVVASDVSLGEDLAALYGVLPLESRVWGENCWEEVHPQWNQQFRCETAVGHSVFRHRWMDPETGRFVSADPLGYVDGASMYQFGLNSPAVYGDPMGLTSRSDIARGRLFYTWHLGWLDVGHMNSRKLVDAWTTLKSASDGEEVLLSISLDQSNPQSAAYKKSTAVFRVRAAADRAQRKRQLLAAWMTVSEQFEGYQGSFPQGLQVVNTALGWVSMLGDDPSKYQQEKVGSSFSTEDLVSNLVAYYATVEEMTWEEVVDDLGGRLMSRPLEKEFSRLLWDCSDARIRMGGNKSWSPVLIDEELSITPSSRHGRRACVAASWRIDHMIDRYDRRFGPAVFPKELRVEPLWEGVELVTASDD